MSLYKVMRFLVPFTVLGALLVAPVAKAVEGQYQWKINFPHDAQWRLLGDQQDRAGYTKTYSGLSTSGSYPQGLSMGFNRGDKTPLRNAMQVVINQHRQVPCSENSYHVISEQNNMVLYTTNLGNCSNGKSLFQVIKSFNMPDGNYSIIYAVDPNLVSHSEIQKMKTAVISASLQ